MNKLFLTLAIIICTLGVAQAQSIQDIQKTKAALAAQENEKAQSAKEKAAAEKKMKSVQDELVQTAKKNQEIERRLNDLESRRKKLEDEQSYLTSRLLEDQGMSTTMFRTIYQSAQIPVYGLYFSKVPKDKILHRMIALNTTLPSLHRRMQGLEEQIGDLNKLQAEIDTLIGQQQKEQRKLVSSSQTLADLFKKRQKNYNTASLSYQKAVKNVEKLQKESKNLEDLVARLKPSLKPDGVERTASSRTATPPPPAVRSGAQDKTLPVAGSIKVNFGETDEIGGKNQGIVFTTQPNAVVISPMPGTVVFAGPFQNFKQLLIIEHSGSYHSLIAGLDHIETNVGAKLQTGEPIGRIDRSNRQKGRLYYELRKNSKPVNPSSVFNIKNG